MKWLTYIHVPVFTRMEADQRVVNESLSIESSFVFNPQFHLFPHKVCTTRMKRRFILLVFQRVQKGKTDKTPWQKVRTRSYTNQSCMADHARIYSLFQVDGKILVHSVLTYYREQMVNNSSFHGLSPLHWQGSRN